ncbi:MAG: hypothetical protein M3Q79_00250 [bacterium]|nr:hypothetical protein [bacterium]
MLEVFGLETLPEDNFENIVKSSKEAMGSIGGSYEVIKIDGNDAILTTLKTHGTYIDGVTFKNDKQYFFRLNAVDETKPEVKELINAILETVQFK